ncbi:tyrosine-type recombinase/integrase [Chromobacterium violaceum]|uniref:Probable prophage integrase n=1 Tax=Chromobacterium violaceum (strain ATCC 12472 / DSM 30191 / JCM 1249 / CCUG 213 / NBRC 12614 / NCIMB 9131 / NCTC 9757 / MK) TaxID=243365 RepID=Q7NRD2_CHRVO|nr:site-specific integrase [Chromobacterium violaceum]AAQ61513.1 probable prophage integrase [Chromobacterium violaceum ATCC 12472]SUX88554.1 Prophage CP4-57 integrase [Chromobacterium violaceum]
MGKLTDMQIKAWIKAGERFEGRGDGDGLWLRFRENDKVPVWRYRYKFAGKSRTMQIGSYAELSLAKAREAVKSLSARVALGHDVAAEKQEKKSAALAKIEEEKNAVTMLALANEYYERMILGRWKHPDIVRRRIDKDIGPMLGKMKVEDIKPRHIDDMLQTIVKRGAPTIANDVLRWTRRMFDYAIKRHIIEINPASAFDLGDAGGKEEARERALSRDELAKLFQAMKLARGFSVENDLAIRLLLLLCVRKMELCAARKEEFDLPAGVWHLPGERSKTGKPIDIPLPALAVEWLQQLFDLAGPSAWLLPARKMQHRMVPHIHEGTIGTALGKVKPHMPDVAAFTIHDLRRTARTHLAELGVDPVVAERCLNHKIKGVEGIYNRHDYFNERRDALNKWAGLLDALDKGEAYNVTPITKGRIKTA